MCEKYGLPYNTGRFSKQIGSVWGKIAAGACRSAAEPGADVVPAIRIIA